MGLAQRVNNFITQTLAHGALMGARAILRHPEVKRRLDLLAIALLEQKRERSSNPLLRAGAKFFSQNDEDGILGEILRRIGKDSGAFVEFGVGDGLENNTICLLMRGWKGAWIGGEPLLLQLGRDNGKLHFEKARVTKENCEQLLSGALSRVGAASADLISVDLDGIDWYVVKALLAGGARPDVFVVEYNGKFPPPVRFAPPYRPDFAWDGTDYFGTSLQSYVDTFDEYGYQLVCCNITGLNAFFVARSHAERFADVPADVSELYVPAGYFGFLQTGHPTSAKTIESFLS